MSTAPVLSTAALAAVATGVAVVSGGVTWLMIHYAQKQGMVDVPNERSSHQAPTPRGGGLGLAAAWLAAMAALRWAGFFSFTGFWGLWTGGLMVAWVGFIDDRFKAPRLVRFSVHFLAAGLAVAAMGGAPPLNLGFVSFDWGWLGHLTLVVGLVWLINLYNFMDGIDGLAGGEALTVSGAAAGILFLSGHHQVAWASLLLGAAALGFLIFNWPPARIFMGDVASGFLGMVLGGLMIKSASLAPEALWWWLILLACFTVDASLTLLRRMGRGEPFYLAHRSHAYQHGALRYGHLPVTLTILLTNVLWLTPWALAGSCFPGLAVVYFLAASAPLFWGCLYFGSGKPPERKES